MMNSRPYYKKVPRLCKSSFGSVQIRKIVGFYVVQALMVVRDLPKLKHFRGVLHRMVVVSRPSQTILLS